MFWVHKRTVSLRWFYEYPQHMFWLRIKKIIFLLLFIEKLGTMNSLYAGIFSLLFFCQTVWNSDSISERNF